MSLNRICLLGNVGKDPEVRYLDTGVAVAQFSLATTVKGYTTKDGKTYADRTEWHNLVAWRGLAETIEKYVHKGDKLYVEGELRYRDYEGSDGVKRRISEIYIEKMEMLTSRQDGKSLPPDPGVAQQPQSPFANPIPNTVSGSAQPVQKRIDISADGSDELPF